MKMELQGGVSEFDEESGGIGVCNDSVLLYKKLISDKSYHKRVRR